MAVELFRKARLVRSPEGSVHGGFGGNRIYKKSTNRDSPGLNKGLWERPTENEREVREAQRRVLGARAVAHVTLRKAQRSFRRARNC